PLDFLSQQPPPTSAAQANVPLLTPSANNWVTSFLLSWTVAPRRAWLLRPSSISLTKRTAGASSAKAPSRPMRSWKSLADGAEARHLHYRTSPNCRQTREKDHLSNHLS